MAKKRQSGDVSIGKFDILATYTYAKALLDGLDDDETKQRGMVAAIMGAHARLWASAGSTTRTSRPRIRPPRSRKRPPSPPKSFDQQIAAKMGEFFDDVFLLSMKRLVEAGLSYDEVKKLPKIPATWGAWIKGEPFRELN